MNISRRPNIKRLRTNNLEMIKVKVTHRNMRKLASLYKEFKWKELKLWYSQCKKNFRFTKRYWRHPNEWIRSFFNTFKKKCGYIYINFWAFYYWDGCSSVYRRRGVLYIKSINKESENLIRYATNNFLYDSLDELPF